jgi:hypothetical protein
MGQIQGSKTRNGSARQAPGVKQPAGQALGTATQESGRETMQESPLRTVSSVRPDPSTGNQPELHQQSTGESPATIRRLGYSTGAARFQSPSQSTGRQLNAEG